MVGAHVKRVIGAEQHLFRSGGGDQRPKRSDTAMQRLIDANFTLKTIGDFVGHRSSRPTQVYAKVTVEALREVALGDGEAVLR